MDSQNNFLDGGVWVHFKTMVSQWTAKIISWMGVCGCILKRRTRVHPFEVKDLSEACPHTKITKNKRKRMQYFETGDIGRIPF
jgi:hypothetical protein